MGHDPNSHQLLSVVSAIHHEGIGEALNDRTLSFSESLDSISAGGMGDVDWRSNLDVVAVTRN